MSAAVSHNHPVFPQYSLLRTEIHCHVAVLSRLRGDFVKTRCDSDGIS